MIDSIFTPIFIFTQKQKMAALRECAEKTPSNLMLHYQTTVEAIQNYPKALEEIERLQARIFKMEQEQTRLFIHPEVPENDLGSGDPVMFVLRGY